MKLVSCWIGLAMTMVASSAQSELIVLAAPPSHLDDYYEEVSGEIFAFHLAYAETILAHGDQVLILSNDEHYDAYANILGADKVLRMPMADIWMRDFALQNAEAPVMFRYSAAGQGHDQDAADDVQEVFVDLAEQAGYTFAETDLINDGGNFVDDYAGKVVLSRKFLTDNGLSEAQAAEKLKAITRAKHIAFIDADEQGGLEHADGVVSFLDANTLLVNAYPDDPAYAKKLKADLLAGLPGVKLAEIVTPYDGSKIYDERFGSACGLYTNALVTRERVYLPQFGILEDERALAQVKLLTSKTVVPVDSRHVCKMGGGVRCMSLQLRGKWAEKLLNFARQQPKPEE